MKHGLLYACGVAALGMFGLAATVAIAQTTANGPYYATPSWDQTLPASTRFIVLSNMNNAAVLDRETGLVWERTPSISVGAGASERIGAVDICWSVSTGGRKGWRLPRVEELMSLADPSNFATSPLPAGNPFLQVVGGNFWAIDYFPGFPGEGSTVLFFPPLGGSPASVDVNPSVVTNIHSVWCVRGGQGSSAFNGQ